MMAVLHDVLEDSDEVTYEVHVSDFGSITADEVKLLTKTKDSAIEDCLNGIESYKHKRTLLRIKLSDRLQNVRSLKLIQQTKPEKVKRYINETVKHCLPLAEKHGIMVDQLNATLMDLN